MNNVKTFSLALALCAALLALPASAQTAMSKTTLSAALNSSSSTVYLTSATGVYEAGNLIAIGPGTPTGNGTTLLYVDKEAMRVTAVNGTRITVSRGYAGTARAPHASGAKVWLGSAQYFATSAAGVTGTCTSSVLLVLPVVVIPTGQVRNCVDSLWVDENTEYNGTAATGVTAVEQSYGRHHVTRLTFSNLTVGSATGAANLAFGTLLYTLPAGAAVVKSAHMSVGLTNTGGVVNANTPDTGLGTVVASGANALLSASPAGSETILTGQTVTNVTGTVLTKTVSDQILPIESSGAHTLYMNTAALWVGADTVKASGTVVIEWVLLK